MNVDITLLGGFAVAVDGRAGARRRLVPTARAASLVKLLALARGPPPAPRAGHRRAVARHVPPTPRAAAAQGRALRPPGARRRHGAVLVLRSDLVLLLPGAEVVVDAVEFRAAGEAALAAGSAERAAEALGAYGGPLLPDDLYEPWAQRAPRAAATCCTWTCCGWPGGGRTVLQEDPPTRQAHLALARQLGATRGDARAPRCGSSSGWSRRCAASWARRRASRGRGAAARRGARGAVDRRPSRRHAEAATRLVGRRDVGDRIRARLDRADARPRQHAAGVRATRGRQVRGARPGRRPGPAARLADRRGAAASAVEGPWPYAPVLEAFGDLCRQHPALLDGLDDIYRDEIDRALSGREVAWSGETAHQRLFVAAAELLRLAAAGHGLLLVVDDMHEADEASLRLLHYLARCAVTEPVLIAAGAPPGHRRRPLREVADSLVARGVGGGARARAARRGGHPPAARRPLPRPRRRRPSQRIWARQRRAAVPGAGAAPRGQEPAAPTVDCPRCRLPRAQTFRRVALLGSTFTTDELLAVAGRRRGRGLPAPRRRARPPWSWSRPSRATGSGTPWSATRCWRRCRRTSARAPGGEVAERLAGSGRAAGPGRPPVPRGRAARAGGAVRAAGGRDGGRARRLPRRARPWSTRCWTTRTGEDRARLLARRGDLLHRAGRPGGGRTAYRDAAAVDHRHRAPAGPGPAGPRGRASPGDLDTAAAALAGLDLEGDAADGPILLAQGNLAYFTRRHRRRLGRRGHGARAAADTRRPVALSSTWSALQGLIAHQRGEWFERFRLELRRTQGNPGLATALFDAHLCVAEYLLYGPIPYGEVIELAEELRRRAEQHGALRGVAFATALIGEAALLMGDLDRAERELPEAVDLHRDVDAPAGEAHCLQRLAEVRLARGDRAEAQRLLQRALPLARWSVDQLAPAAADLRHDDHGGRRPGRGAGRSSTRPRRRWGRPTAARSATSCWPCPPPIACADAGDLDAARAPPRRRRGLGRPLGGQRLGGRSPSRRAPTSPAPRATRPASTGCSTRPPRCSRRRPAAGRGPVRARPGLADRPAPGARPGQLTARTAAASTR